MNGNKMILPLLITNLNITELAYRVSMVGRRMNELIGLMGLHNLLFKQLYLIHREKKVPD